MVLAVDNVVPTLTEKNLYCLRVLLNISMFLGGVLGASWYLVLETLQHADHLLVQAVSAHKWQSGRSASELGNGKQLVFDCSAFIYAIGSE